MALRLGAAPGFLQVRAPVTLAYRRHAGAATAEHGMELKALEDLLNSERKGHYPGGPSRAADRGRILSLHARPVALERLRVGDFASAWRVYRDTLRWHLADLRLRFILGFPLLALYRALFPHPRKGNCANRRIHSSSFNGQ